MKSPMIQTGGFVPQEEKGRYSELQVLRSNAGFYVGTTYTHEDGFTEPGSRDSDYFRTRKEAEDYLLSCMANLDGDVDEAKLRTRP